MSSPDLSNAEVQAVAEVLRTRFLSMGPRVQEFESRFAAYLGSRFAVGVSSGTAGLHLSILAAGVREGDLVITTPFSFVASANCILYERATPIFVDVDPTTLNLEPNAVVAMVEGLINDRRSALRQLPAGLRQSLGDRLSNAELRAILPVHVFGQPADMDPILRVARAHGLAVIEDACEAIGAEYKKRKVGTLGDVAVFAFYPNKQMTTGEGGVVVSNREDWAELLRSLRNQGRDAGDSWLEHSRLGYNYRLDEMSAALGLAQMSRLEELLAKRERVARMYTERIEEIEGVEAPQLAPTTTRMSWFVYVSRLAPGMDRIRIMQALEQQGIPSRPYFHPIHLQPFYRQRFGYQPGDYPVAEETGRSCLALPFSGVMTEEQVDRVCRALQLALRMI